MNEDWESRTQESFLTTKTPRGLKHSQRDTKSLFRVRLNFAYFREITTQSTGGEKD